MQKTDTTPGVKGSFYIASRSKQERSVQRVEQFWGQDGIRVDYAGESEIYNARDGLWIHLDHTRKEASRDVEKLPFPLSLNRVEVHGLLPFAQSLFQQAGVKTTAPKKWSGIYFGVPAVFTELHTSDGEVCFQLVLATIDKWTLPLRMVVVPSAEDLYVRDTLSVRRQLIPSELFSVPREYKLVR